MNEWKPTNIVNNSPYYSRILRRFRARLSQEDLPWNCAGSVNWGPTQASVQTVQETLHQDQKREVSCKFGVVHVKKDTFLARVLQKCQISIYQMTINSAS